MFRPPSPARPPALIRSHPALHLARPKARPASVLLPLPLPLVTLCCPTSLFVFACEFASLLSCARRLSSFVPLFVLLKRDSLASIVCSLFL
eukprot:m.226564 g.226564  ORF g.226564 m.226564 type:complete len:91 (+) comp16979_c0_seq1:1587-1859(+)